MLSHSNVNIQVSISQHDVQIIEIIKDFVSRGISNNFQEPELSCYANSCLGGPQCNQTWAIFIL